MSKTVFHKADSRGSSNLGWLQITHTFNYAEYYNTERINFGLRVLNDDCVVLGMGFDIHSHSNMEIVLIPLEGDLKHMDSVGNNAVIKNGDVQIISAGYEISHSE